MSEGRDAGGAQDPRGHGCSSGLRRVATGHGVPDGPRPERSSGTDVPLASGVRNSRVSTARKIAHEVNLVLKPATYRPVAGMKAVLQPWAEGCNQDSSDADIRRRCHRRLPRPHSSGDPGALPRSFQSPIPVSAGPGLATMPPKARTSADNRATYASACRRRRAAGPRPRRGARSSWESALASAPVAPAGRARASSSSRRHAYTYRRSFASITTVASGARQVLERTS